MASAARTLLLTLLAGYVLWAACLTAFQRTLIYPGQSREAPPAPSLDAMNAVRVALPTSEEHDAPEVEGWLLLGDGRSAGAPGPALVYAHGNAELIDDLPPRVAPYRRMGISVLLPEYRGFGRSGGSPEEEEILSDWLRFVDWLRARPEVGAAPIAYHGYSIGAAVVARLAEQRPPAALILESGFTSMPAMAKRYALPGFLVADKWDTEGALSRYEGPVLLVHGQRDRTIPPSHSEALAAVCQRALTLWHAGDHTSGPLDSARYWQTIRRFLKEAELSR